MKTLRILKALLAREIKLVFRNQSELLTTFFFFIIVCSLFPFGVNPSSKVLPMIGPGMIWISALLASTVSNARFLLSDFNDGSLEQIFLAPIPSTLIVLVKVFVQWLMTGLPLLIVTPFLALQFGLRYQEILVLLISLAIGTPLLTLIGALGSALTLGGRGGGGLVAILVLPLYIPVLIFGVGSVLSFSSGIGPETSFLVLGAILVFALVFLPYAIASSIKLALE